MSGNKVSIDIHAPLRTVYDVITDFEAYPEFLPESKKVVVNEINDKVANVTFNVSIIKKIKYTLDIKFSPPKGLTWKLVKGDMMKKNSGHWKLTEKKKGLVHAEYLIDMDFGGMVPKAISSKLVGTNLPAMMKAFRDRAEELA